MLVYGGCGCFVVVVAGGLRRGAGARGEAALAVQGLPAGAERVPAAAAAAAQVPLQPHVTRDPCARTCTRPCRGRLGPPPACGCGAGPWGRRREGEERQEDKKERERGQGNERANVGVDPASLSAVGPLCQGAVGWHVPHAQPYQVLTTDTL